MMICNQEEQQQPKTKEEEGKKRSSFYSSSSSVFLVFCCLNSPVYDHNKPSGYDKVVKINQTLQKPTVVRKKEPNAASMNSRRSHRLDKGHSGCSGSLWENSESQKDTNSVGHNKHKRNDYNTQTHESDAKPDVFIIDRKRDYELSVQKSTSHQSLLSTRPW